MPPVIRTVRSGSSGRGIVEHDLADVLALAQVAEGLPGSAHVPAVDRRVAQGAALEQPGDLGEHLPDALGPELDEVEGAVGDARVLGGDLLGVADVGLAHLEEAPAAGQQPSEASTNSPASELRTTSMPSPPVAVEELRP